MTDCTSCGGCAGGCGGCRSRVLLLTEPELRLLRQLGELAFLPAACTRTDATPVYLDGSGNRAETSAAILALQIKRLISVDFALPLKGFDYAGYEAWPIRGSMALTAAVRRRSTLWISRAAVHNNESPRHAVHAGGLKL